MKCMKINPAEYKILVVDDVQSNVLLLKALLGREGFGIVYAMNGTEALEKVKSEHPDLILLDVMMPDMDGFEVAGHLKVEPEQAEIPIIFLTALNDSASVLKGFQLGANVDSGGTSTFSGGCQKNYSASDRGIEKDNSR